MVNLRINNIPVSVPEGTSILDAAKTAGIKIPTLCFLKDINEIGACRVCVVEIKGKDKLVAACNNQVEEGMEILTSSPKVLKSRKTTVRLILSQHNSSCTTCSRNGKCELQTLSEELGINDNPYPVKAKTSKWNNGFPLIKDESKCINCMRCVNVCEKVQGLGIWEAEGTGTHAHVKVRKGLDIDDVPCAICGQCVTHCPVGALSERNDICKVRRALADEEKITVVQVAPAVRSAWAEDLGADKETASVGRMVSALREFGFNYVFDTNYAADLTIMEEGTELIGRLREKKGLPMFTSCCPGWVRFIKSQYPELVPNLSSAKSPQQMFGAMAKTYFAEKLGVPAEKIYCVSVMPCISKKDEATMFGNDVDAVLTTREFAKIIKETGIDITALPESEFDSPMGSGTGAAVIFGTSGGVMEAALRTAVTVITGTQPDADAFAGLRPDKEKTVRQTLNVGGMDVRVAIVSGLGETRRLLDAIKRGEESFDFVEVMACPGGCRNGGGQPIYEDENSALTSRANVLYGLDSENSLRFSHLNPEINNLYSDFLSEPLSSTSHHLLHTEHVKNM